VLGHESLGRVLDPGPASGFKKGDLVVGIVRRPDTVPCPNCAVGEWDMCRNGQYTERGIKQIDGYMSEQWRIEPEYAIKVDPTLGILGVLLEPTTVVSKAWEMVKATGQRSFWEPSWHSWRSVIGPIGLKWPSFTVSTLIETGFFEDKRRSSLVSRNTHQGHELLNSQTPEVHGKELLGVRGSLAVISQVIFFLIVTTLTNWCGFGLQPEQ
jgi:hypothetical protein